MEVYQKPLWGSRFIVKSMHYKYKDHGDANKRLFCKTGHELRKTATEQTTDAHGTTRVQESVWNNGMTSLHCGGIS